MPMFRLIETETGELLRVRRMDHEVAATLNKQLPAGQEWRQGLGSLGYKPASRSFSSILRFLDCEGFSEYHVNQIMRWYLGKQQDGSSYEKYFLKTRNKFKEQMRPLHDKARKAIGRFIALEAKASFEAGLRIGLAVALRQNLEEIERAVKALDYYRWAKAVCDEYGVSDEQEASVKQGDGEAPEARQIQETVSETSGPEKT